MGPHPGVETDLDSKPEKGEAEQQQHERGYLRDQPPAEAEEGVIVAAPE